MSHNSPAPQKSASPDNFIDRHIGPNPAETASMLSALGVSSLEELIDQTIPSSIRFSGSLQLPSPATEVEVLQELNSLAGKNKLWRSFIGLGYHDCVTPAIILRNILENPGWYTQYTPYQPEISQGRLEALLNFQTMICELTAMEIANASLLDEATAVAEAMTLCHRVKGVKGGNAAFFVADHCHPQTIEVVRTRAGALGIKVIIGDYLKHDFTRPTFGVLVQYPTTDGAVLDLAPFIAEAHQHGAMAVVAADLLSLTLLRAPGEFGADVVIGSAQRFGVPVGFGGPHAAYMSTRTEYQRNMPGRLVGISRDASGKPALRLALQTREQHIRREKATSNICTAQVLLAVVASMYAVYHGPERLRNIAHRIHLLASALADGLRKLGYRLSADTFFDTLRVIPGPRSQQEILKAARRHQINLRVYRNGDLGIALGESATNDDIRDLYEVFGGDSGSWEPVELSDSAPPICGSPHARTSRYLTQPLFHRYHTETEMLRYMNRLQSRDLSLTTSLIPLGSCTLKLNATAEMIPITWPGFASIHPFVPPAQAEGYREMIDRLGRWLCEITGFSGITLQPNAGAQGEYTGLLLIRAYHQSRGDKQRKVCLIPRSAHGTNPASAAMAGMEVVVVDCDHDGNIDLADLKAKSEQHKDRLAALMVTYPSTHGVFEEAIREICAAVHECGGQVYLDGANMNALVGLCRPAEIGADVCHLNLHKTFCIPHGGGGPGMGPVCVATHLVPFLPKHPLVRTGGKKGIGPVSAGHEGSASILPISYAYIALMGAEGLAQASRMAILNANYVAARLNPHYPVLYKGKNGRVAHECIIDLRPITDHSGVTAEDVAKRLMDYGFHAPTMSFPVAGTLMIEPTESESLAELDRFCEALISIREEIREIEQGLADRHNNLLKGAPHSALCLAKDPWDKPYSRERAAFPSEWTREYKFWPATDRIDNVYGDRNLCCTWNPEQCKAE